MRTVRRYHKPIPTNSDEPMIFTTDGRYLETRYPGISNEAKETGCSAKVGRCMIKSVTMRSTPPTSLALPTRCCIALTHPGPILAIACDSIQKAFMIQFTHFGPMRVSACDSFQNDFRI